MDGSVIPNTNSNCVITPGTTPSMAGPVVYLGAIYPLGNLANGHYDVSFQARSSANSFHTQAEIYQTPGDDAVPHKLRFDYATSTTAGTSVDIAAGSSVYNKWVHWAISVSSTQQAVLYAILEGFNPASPSYLVHSSVGTVRSDADMARFCIEASDNTTVATNTRQGHLIVSEFEPTEAEILAQFAQRAPTAAFAAHDHLYLPCNDAANVNDDQGNPGTNWTLTGTFAGAANQPFEWSGLPPLWALGANRANWSRLLSM